MEETKINKRKFYVAILEAYANGARLTARECAVSLMPRGLCKYGLRQEVQPRIVEMCKKGWLEEVGKAFDFTTKKNVTVYAIKENEND